MKKKLKDITLREWICFRENCPPYIREKEAVTAIKEGNLDYEIEIYLLDANEVNYLKKLIQPFRDRVKYIYLENDKFREGYVNLYYVCKDEINPSIDEVCFLPNFKKGTMYINLELGKWYTLNELHL